MGTGARADKLTIRPLTRTRVDHLRQVVRGTWGAECWDLWPRYTARQQRELGLTAGSGVSDRRRAALALLARRRRAPGLLAYRGRGPVGWIAIGPRLDFSRIDASRATPPLDTVPAWVIPCITVRRDSRGEGIAVALIRAAVEYAAARGAPAVEAYPRAGDGRVHDDFAFYGTVPMFRRAGFRVARRSIPGLPRNWTPRYTMRIACTSKTSRPRHGRSRPA